MDRPVQLLGPDYASPAVIERFTAKVQVDLETGCWRWRATKSKGGYGQFWDGTRLDYAHRFAFRCAGRRIPDGKELGKALATPKEPAETRKAA